MKTHKNKQRESDIRQAINKRYSDAQHAREAKEKQQERLVTSMFGANEERGKKLMGLAGCLEKMGEKEKDREEVNAKSPTNNGAKNTEEEDARADRMDIEGGSRIDQEESGGDSMDEGHEDKTKLDILNKTLAERGKGVMNHMAQKMKVGVEGKASKSIGEKC